MAIDPTQPLLGGQTPSSVAEPVQLSEDEKRLWEQWGFDQSLEETDPASVHFITESLLGETIALYQRTGAVLLNNDLGVQNRAGKAFIKVNGEWTACSEIIGKIHYAQEMDKKFEVCNLIGWNFVHPDGLVEKDSFTYQELYPIGKLVPDVHQRLLQEGQTWLNLHPGVDEGVEKPCLMQVVTSQELNLSEGWYARNLEDTVPQHAFIRLIDQQGNLYSFGSRSPYSKENNTSGLGYFLSTWSTHLSTPDYIERWTVPLRRVTTLPLTQERFQNLIHFANEMNSGSGLRFNFARQNCVRIVQQGLHIAGIDVTTKISLPSLVYAMLPSLHEYPVVGAPLSAVASVTSSAAHSVFSKIPTPQWSTPECVKTACRHIGSVCAYLPKKAAALSVSGLALCLGGGRMVPRNEEEQKHQENNTHNDDRLTSFRKLISWETCADVENCYLFYTYPLIQWQESQESTFEYRRKAGFCIDPAQGDRVVHH